jgi:hypothetical protein
MRRWLVLAVAIGSFAIVACSSKSDRPPVLDQCGAVDKPCGAASVGGGGGSPGSSAADGGAGDGGAVTDAGASFEAGPIDDAGGSPSDASFNFD